MPNVIAIVGNIKEKPELKKTSTDISKCTFTVACTHNMAKDKTSWLNIVTWRGTAEYIAKYGDKGRMVSIHGELQQRSYEDKTGVKRYVYEVVANNVTLLDKQKSVMVDESKDFEIIDESSEDLPFNDDR